MKYFETQIVIRFQHCDPAGIVFYPRYVEMFNQTVEEWFDRGLGCGFRTLHLDRHMGVPTVRLNCEFRAMSVLEDVLDFRLQVVNLGSRSLDLRVEAHCGDELRCAADITLVCTDQRQKTSAPWPDFLRIPVQQYLKDEKA